jgi:hypothetical protein
MGCVFIRHDGKHDWYQNPRTKMYQPIFEPPRDQGISGPVGHQEVKRSGLISFLRFSL